MVFELDQNDQGKTDKDAEAALQFLMLVGKFRVGADPTYGFPTMVTVDGLKVIGSDKIIKRVRKMYKLERGLNTVWI